MKNSLLSVFSTWQDFWRTIYDSFKWSFPYFRAERKRVSMLVLVSLTAGIVASSQFVMLKYFIDTLMQTRSLQTLGILLVAYFGTSTISNLCNYLHVRLFMKITTQVLFLVRRQLFEKYLSFSVGYFGDHKSGKIIHQITSETQTLERGFGSIFALIREGLETGLYVGLLLHVSFTYSMLILLVTPVIHALWVRDYRNDLKEFVAGSDKASAAMTQIVLDSQRAMRVIRVFGGEKRILEQFVSRQEESRAWKLKTNKASISMATRYQFMDIVAASTVFFLFGRDVLAGKATSGEFVVFITLITMISRRIHSVVTLVTDILQMHVAGNKVIETLSLNPSVEDRGSAVLGAEIQEVRFQGVSFGYGKERGDLLSQVDLTAKRGQVVVILGANGAGKTSMLNLIPRLYDPSEGKVSINGEDSKSYSIASLRQRIALVGQETGILDDTVYNNIRYGRQDASREDVLKAARQAGAHDFISSLPQGYDTPVGEDGNQLSQGQRQRLSIARAFLKDAPILILDEPVASLDRGAIDGFKSVLRSLCVGRITFLITHQPEIIPPDAKVFMLKEKTLTEVSPSAVDKAVVAAA